MCDDSFLKSGGSLNEQKRNCTTLLFHQRFFLKNFVWLWFSRKGMRNSKWRTSKHLRSIKDMIKNNFFSQTQSISV